MTRYDVISPRKRGDADKTYWHRIGAAFDREKGGLSVVLDSLPLPDSDGQVRLLIVEAKTRDETPAQSAAADNVTPLRRATSGSSRGPAENDDIPF